MKTSYRQQLDPRNTFDYSTPNLRTSSVPQLSPIYKDVSSKGMELAQALGTVSNTIQAIQPFMNQYAQAKYEEGQLAALTGEDKPTKGYFQVKAYEEAEGELVAQTKYKQELMDFYTNNYTNLDPEQWQQGLEEIGQKYLNGQSENFIRKFVPVAVELETSLNEQYQNYLRQETHAKSLNAIGGISDVETGDLVNDMLREGFQGVENIEDFLSNPYLHGQLSADKDFRNQLSMSLRTSLNDIQARGREMGLSRREISSQYIRQLGKMAVSYGMPELLDMAYEMDESGVSLAKGELADTIDRYKEQAEANRLSIIQASEKQNEENIKMNIKAFRDESFSSMLELELTQDPAERAKMAAEMLTDLREQPEFYQLSSRDIESLTKNLVGIVSHQTDLPARSNQTMLADLQTTLLTGTLYPYEVIDAKEQGVLAYDDYVSLLKASVKQQQEFGDATSDRYKDWNAKIIKDTIDMMYPGGPTDFNGTAEAKNLRGIINNEYMKLISQNKGQIPTPGQLREEVLNPILETYGTSYEKLLSKGIGDNNVDLENQELHQKVDEVGQKVDRAFNPSTWQAIGDFFTGNPGAPTTPEGLQTLHLITSDTATIDSAIQEGDTYLDIYQTLSDRTGTPELVEQTLVNYLKNKITEALTKGIGGNVSLADLQRQQRKWLEELDVPEKIVQEILGKQ